MPRTPSIKLRLIQALAAQDYAAVAEMATGGRRVFSRLISLAFDKEDILCWRAITAMGACAAAVARDDPGRVRNVAQRIIWSAREESGGMGWSAPELLAEIACASPHLFADIPAIAVSLHGEDEEKVFLKGVLWAIARMAAAGIRDIPGAREVVLGGLGDPDPQVRGMAALAALQAGVPGAETELRKLREDTRPFTFYDGEQLVHQTVAEAAFPAVAPVHGLTTAGAESPSRPDARQAQPWFKT